jgi:hypothetical protein
MIEIADELSRLSLKLTTKYRITDQKRLQFLEESEEEAANETNESLKKKDSAMKESLIEAIALDD